MKFLLLVAAVVTLGVTVQSEKITFDDGKYNLNWVLAKDNKSLEITVDAEAAGWIGVGFSNYGNMTGADLIIAQVVADSNTLKVTDNYSEKNGRPTLDTQQNLATDMVATREDKKVHLKFTRPLDTGDKTQDIVIPLDGIYILWAVSDTLGTELEKHARKGHTKAPVRFDSVKAGVSSLTATVSLISAILVFVNIL